MGEVLIAPASIVRKGPQRSEGHRMMKQAAAV